MKALTALSNLSEVLTVFVVALVIFTGLDLLACECSQVTTSALLFLSWSFCFLSFFQIGRASCRERVCLYV